MVWMLDYTERGAHRTEDAADLTSQRLSRLVGALQVFVGHDLPNQLVAIQGLARLIEQSGEELGGEGRDLLNRLAALAQQANARTRRVAEVGRLLREPAWGEPLALDDAVAEAVAQVKVLGGTHDVRLVARPGGLRVRVGAALLQAVLVQLLKTAVALSAGPHGGELAVASRRVEGGVELALHSPVAWLASRPPDLAPLGQEAAWAGGVGPADGDPTRPVPADPGWVLVHQAVALWRGRLSMSRGEDGCALALFLPDGPGPVGPGRSEQP